MNRKPNNEEALSVTAPRASVSHLTATKGTDTMNDMTLSTNSQPTMSSQEVADLVESRHDKVKLSIERLAKRGVIQLPPMGEVKNHIGQAVSVYFVGKRDSYIVVAQLCPEFTARLVDRWQELEAEKSTFDPMKALADPATMRNLLLGYSEKVLTLESTVAEQAPKVAALDRLSTAEGSLCLTDAAKHLQIAPKRFIQWLHAHDWIFRRIGSNKWTGYQPRLKQGVLIQKVTIIPLEDGTDKINEQVRVTPKGLSRLAELLREDAA